MSRLGLFAAILALGTSLAHASSSITSEDYARAERFMAWNKDRYVTNADLQHHWIGKRDRFWYLRTGANGAKQFVVVDASSGKTTPAFDQKKIGDGLSKLLDTKVEDGQLPFSTFSFSQNDTAIVIRVKGVPVTCQLETGSCVTQSGPGALAPGDLRSPDGKQAVLVRDHNLWVRTIGRSDSVQLTIDGTEHYEYASPLGSSGRTISDLRHPAPRLPLAIWSPNSRYVLTHRLDERQVAELFLIQSVPEDDSMRPKLYSYHYAMPGDEHIPMLEPVVFDALAHRQVSLRVQPLAGTIATLVERGDIWWSPDSTKVYFLKRDRFFKTVALVKADLVTGEAGEVLHESSNTTVGLLQGERAVRVLQNGDVIWYSQRDGWAHLYYYDGATGTMRNQITRGTWVVRSIVRVDEAANRLYFMASGRESGWDPYEQCLYSIQFDGSGIRLLTPEKANHELPVTSIDPLLGQGETDRFSPSGKYFVDSYSRPDMPPVFVLRRADGRLIRRLEEADISRLRDGGYTTVEPFEVLAADGKTPIYGNLYRPSRFDPSRKYPIIDSIYPLPTVIRTGKGFSSALFGYFEAQSLAELGFIVVTIDGRGTAYRSRAFSDYSYGQLSKASEPEDHIAGIRQLAQRYPYMDLDRVGADGASAGGYGAAHALLAYPDFYKVAVAAEGNQDQRAGPAALLEMLLGPLEEKTYLAASNLPLAANLKGKLLLAHGEMDESAPPSLTMKLVDALVKANKPFDLLIIPNETHLMFVDSPYFIRRKWDYFVRNLLDTEPPPASH